jgi:hypothetical protein
MVLGPTIETRGKRAEEIRDEARTWIDTATREIEEREKMKDEKGQ